MKSGVLELQSLASLKASAIVALIVLWNAGCLVGVYLNGGFGQLTNRGSAFAMAGTCAAACAFALGVALSARLQDALLAESRRHNFRQSDFFFVALITGVLAVFALIAANAYFDAA